MATLKAWSAVRILCISSSLLMMMPMAHAQNHELELETANCGMDPSAPGSEYDCKFFHRNLKRDSHECLIDPKIVKSEKPLEGKVRGTILYAGILPHAYHYAFVPKSDGTLAVTVKVHFIEAEDTDRDHLQAILNDAQAFWQLYNPSPEIYSFSFLVTNDENAADFSVHLREVVKRGPYDRQWGKDWDALVVKHELGHMMGLDDEYPEAIATLRPRFFYEHSEKFGNVESVMYNSYSNTNKPMPYHYFLIFRRAFCQEAVY